MLAVSLPAYPWANLSWGALPLISAVALVPVTLALCLLTAQRGWRAGCALGVAAAGVLFVHTSALGSMLLVGLPMVAFAAKGRNSRTLLAGGPAAVAMMILTAPIVALVIAGAAERAHGDAPAAATPMSAAVSAWLSVSVLREWSGVGGAIAAVIAVVVTAADCARCLGEPARVRDTRTARRNGHLARPCVGVADRQPSRPETEHAVVLRRLPDDSDGYAGRGCPRRYRDHLRAATCQASPGRPGRYGHDWHGLGPTSPTFLGRPAMPGSPS